MSLVKLPEETALAVIDAQNALEIFTKGGLDATLDGIEKRVRAMTFDVSTPAGRDHIRSTAYQVSRTKTALDAEGKKLTEDWRKATGKVNTERKRAEERLEALAAEVRKPLNDFERKEADRVLAHENAIAEITGVGIMVNAHPDMAAELIEEHMRDFHYLHAGRNWEEFELRAKVAREDVAARLARRFGDRVQYEADQAELSRLRKESEERAQCERDERLKAEAAENARLEAERKAAKEAEKVKWEAERVQREIEAARKREEQARIDAEKRAKEAEARAEREAVEAQERSTKQKLEAEAREKQLIADRKVAEERAAQAAKTAKEKAEREKELAVVRERERIQKEQAEKLSPEHREDLKTIKDLLDRLTVPELIRAHGWPNAFDDAVGTLGALLERRKQF